MTKSAHKQFGFYKSLRLLTAGDYKAVFDKATYKVSSRQVLILANRSNRTEARLGLVIAKKNVRYAVQRNRIKRIIRESFRLNQNRLSGVDSVVLARQGLDKLDNQALHTLFNKLWMQLERKSQ